MSTSTTDLGQKWNLLVLCSQHTDHSLAHSGLSMNAYWYGLKTDCKLGMLLPTYVKSSWNLEEKKKTFPISSVIPQRSGEGGVREPQLWCKMFSLLVGREDKGTLAGSRLTQFGGCGRLPCAVVLLGPPAQDQGQLLPRWHEFKELPLSSDCWTLWPLPENSVPKWMLWISSLTRDIKKERDLTVSILID